MREILPPYSRQDDIIAEGFRQQIAHDYTVFLFRGTIASATRDYLFHLFHRVDNK